MRIKTGLSVVATLIFGAAVGCSGQPVADETTAPENTGTTASHAANTGGSGLVKGVVIETMNSGNYTYVNVDTGEEKIWAAAGQFDVAVGDRVAFPLETPMQDFHSNTLDRDFPLIYFASFIAPEGEEPAMGRQATMGGMPPGHPPLGGAAGDPEQAVAAGDIEKAAGGTSVAEVWSNRADLAGTAVIVSGRVVKYNAAIMGHNWFHIQDGTGDAADGSNDLTVTTDAQVAVGDVVTITGTVVVDRDFGAGYVYTVMLEDATVVK